VGVSCSSRREAEAFFSQVLGLPLVRSFVVSSEVGLRIFGLSGEAEVLVFNNGQVKIEVFVTSHKGTLGYVHLGLEVDDVSQVFDRCRKHTVECFSVTRGEKQLFFVRDSSGNLYELSEKKP
jgi:catechol 2,3-dioxygenase-like lactoylglutathione lyase family enzyme